MYPNSFAIFILDTILSNFDTPIEDNVTLASLMKSAGYATALIGKWGIAGDTQMGGAPRTTPAWPTKREFDYIFGYGNHRTGHRHYPYEDPHQDPENNCNAIWDAEKGMHPIIITLTQESRQSGHAKLEWYESTRARLRQSRLRTNLIKNKIIPRSK